MKKIVLELSILAGGLGERLGRDKARVKLDRKTLLAHVRTEARKTGWPVRVVRKDAVVRCGPIGGIYTALNRSKADVVIFMACDMPFVSASHLKHIANAVTEKSQAVFTKQNTYATFPCAIHTTALPKIKEQIASGDFSLQTLARKLRAKLVRAKKSELFDIDTPEDLRRSGWYDAKDGSETG